MADRDLNKLPPCPVCGGPPTEAFDAALVCCEDCGIEVHGASPEEAGATWYELTQVNRIAALTADLDEARELLREVAGAACTVKLDGATDWSLKHLYDAAAKCAAFLERKP